MPFKFRFLAIALLSLATTGDADACACCANLAQRNVSTGKVSGYDTAELARVAFGETAELFTGEADVADIQGLAATASSYALEVTRDGTAWTFTLKTEGKVAGSLTFSPDKLAKFEVDTRLAEAPASGNVTLYKEWKQTASVTGTGMFKLPKDSALSLILQGRGNSCTSAEDFTHWSLVAQGAGVSFQFFGDLAKPQ